MQLRHRSRSNHQSWFRFHEAMSIVLMTTIVMMMKMMIVVDVANFAIERLRMRWQTQPSRKQEMMKS
jgi:hypothetical protein